MVLNLLSRSSWREIKRRSSTFLICSGFRLTQREVETVDHLVHEFSTRQIAERMGISRNTVKAFLRSIMMKMGADSRAGIIARILQNIESAVNNAARMCSAPRRCSRGKSAPAALQFLSRTLPLAALQFASGAFLRPAFPSRAGAASPSSAPDFETRRSEYRQSQPRKRLVECSSRLRVMLESRRWPKYR